MEFEYKDLAGNAKLKDFADLLVLAEGPVDLEDGWQGDRVNFCVTDEVFIEFRSGPEGPPGFQANGAWEVTEEYVKEKYCLSDGYIDEFIRAKI